MGGNWDEDAFWRPTSDRNGVLLGIFLVLFVLHFDSILGLYANSTLLFGFWPIEFFYQVVMVVPHLDFMYLLYRYWPEPPGDIDG